MKKLFLAVFLFCASCTTVEPYYRSPQNYDEQLEANANPQNEGYVLRHREVDHTGNILGFLYVATAVIDLVDHVHNRRCRH